MPGKRQHYVPKFMLRRFAIDPRNKKSLIYKLDVVTGRPSRVNPVNEVVQSHYYRIELPDGTIDDTADELLDRFESEAAPRIARLASANQDMPNDMDVFWLANFIASLKPRTPAGREQLREMDVQLAELSAEVRLSDPREWPETVSEEERLQMLDDLRRGVLGFASTPSREVGLMFAALEKTAGVLFDEMRWRFLCAPEGHCFVLSDDPVNHYDPTPKMKDAGASYVSSPNAKTVIPLDPSLVLVLEPAAARSVRHEAATPKDVDDLNLLIYAQAAGAIYGQSQAALARVRKNAKSRPRVIASYARRPPRLWITEGSSDVLRSGPQTFRSTYRGITAEHELYVPAEAYGTAAGG